MFVNSSGPRRVSHATFIRGPSSVSYPTFLTFESFDQTFFQKICFFSLSYPFLVKTAAGIRSSFWPSFPLPLTETRLIPRGCHQTSAFWPPPSICILSYFSQFWRPAPNICSFFIHFWFFLAGIIHPTSICILSYFLMNSTAKLRKFPELTKKIRNFIQNNISFG